MNSDIEGFEADYQNLVERFKDDELANILIAANKEISAKIDERKRKIARDKLAMNELIEKAELSKNKLVKITAEKKALELCLAKILDAYEFYSRALTQVIEYTQENTSDLSKCFFENNKDMKSSFSKTIREITADNKEYKEKAIEEEDKIMEDDSSNTTFEEDKQDETVFEEQDLITEEEIDEEVPEKEEIDMTSDEDEETDEDKEMEEDNNNPTPDKVDEIKVTEEKAKEKGSIRIDDIDFDSISNFDDSL